MRLGAKITAWARRMRMWLGLWVAGAKFKVGEPRKPKRPRCSFCGLVCDSFDTVVVVYRGPLDVWICRECITHWKAILDADKPYGESLAPLNTRNRDC